jgi:hypothetical protein
MSRKHVRMVGKEIVTIHLSPDGEEHPVTCWQDVFLEEMSDVWLPEHPIVIEICMHAVATDDAERALKCLIEELGGKCDLFEHFESLFMGAVLARYEEHQSESRTAEEINASIRNLENTLRGLKKARQLFSSLYLSPHIHETILKLREALEREKKNPTSRQGDIEKKDKTTDAIVRLYYGIHRILGESNFQLMHYLMKAVFPENKWSPHYLSKKVRELKKTSKYFM